MSADRKVPSDLPPDAAWTLQDAESRFGELVRRAQTEGPQRITAHGRDAVLVISATQIDRILPLAADELPFVAFMESLFLDGLDIARELDIGRDAQL